MTGFSKISSMLSFLEGLTQGFVRATSDRSDKRPKPRSPQTYRCIPLTLGAGPGPRASLQASSTDGRPGTKTGIWTRGRDPVQNLWKEAVAWGDRRHGRTRDLPAFPEPVHCRTGSKLNTDYTITFSFLYNKLCVLNVTVQLIYIISYLYP